MLKYWKKKEMEFKKNEKKNAGFTLIELIIVIVIMVVLVALIIPNLLSLNEKSRATKDYNSLDGLYTAYCSVIATTDDPGSVQLSDIEVLNKVGCSSLTEFEDNLESNQFESSSIQCYYDATKNEYGICVTGQNGYTGAKIDNKGTRCVLGQKGSANAYVDEATRAEVSFGTH